MLLSFVFLSLIYCTGVHSTLPLPRLPISANLVKSNKPNKSTKASSVSKKLAKPHSNATVIQRSNDDAELDLSQFENEEYPIQLMVVVNLVVHMAWLLLPEEFMKRHAVESFANEDKGRWWSSIIASFSHKSTAHMTGNMAAFAKFGPTVLDYLGEFWYYVSMIGAGVVSTWTSRLYRAILFIMTNDTGFRQTLHDQGSLGFSGILCSLAVYYASAKPNKLLSLGDHPICKAKYAIKTAMTSEFFMMLGSFIFPSPIDHAAHLGGYLYGYISIPIYKWITRVTQGIREKIEEIRYRFSQRNSNPKSKVHKKRPTNKPQYSNKPPIFTTQNSSNFQTQLIQISKMVGTAMLLTVLYFIFLQLIVLLLNHYKVVPSYLQPMMIYKTISKTANKKNLSNDHKHVRDLSKYIQKSFRRIRRHWKKVWRSVKLIISTGNRM